MPSLHEFKTPQPTSIDYRLDASPSRFHGFRCLAMGQAEKLIDLNAYAGASHNPSMSFNTFSDAPELPALIADVGGSSDSSLFELTPVPTLHDEGDTCMLPSDNKQNEVEDDLGDLMMLNGAWDLNQSPRKYRTLAPKPPTPRPEQLPPNDGQQRYPTTQAGILCPMALVGGDMRWPLHLPRSLPPALSQTGSSSVLGQELLLQKPATSTASTFSARCHSPHIFNDQTVANSTDIVDSRELPQSFVPHTFTRFHEGQNFLDNDTGQTPLPLPAATSPDIGSDFDALFENNAFDTSLDNVNDQSYLGSNIPAQSLAEKVYHKLDNTMDPRWDQDSDPFRTPSTPKMLSNDNASGSAQLLAGNQHQGNIDNRFSMQMPTAHFTLPRNSTANSTNYMQPMQGTPNGMMPTLPTPQDTFFEDDILPQQHWGLNQNSTTPSTPIRNTYEAAYPPLSDEPGNAYGPMSGTSDEFNFSSSSPVYYSSSNNTRNPSLPTTPIRADERGHRDTSRDQLLLQGRENGMSFKDIKEMCGFAEAESTLRGRHRTLTKPKEHRVRKPTWPTKAVKALVAAVHTFARDNNVTNKFLWAEDKVWLEDEDDLKKIGWKKVADLIEMDGCYHYGNSTTKQKYLELRKAALSTVDF